MPELDLYRTAPATLPEIRTGSSWGFWWEMAWQDAVTGTETPLDLTGAEARLVLRRKATDATVFLTLTVGAGLEVDLTTARIRAALSSSQTLPLTPGEAVWGLAIRLAGGDWWEAFAGTVPIEIGRARA